MKTIDHIDAAILSMAGHHTELSNPIIEKLQEAKRLVALEAETNRRIRYDNTPGARAPWELNTREG